MRQALRDLGLDDEVLAFRDDLSCGPIDPDDPATRAAWWAPYYSNEDFEDIAAFWKRLTTGDDRLVLWFSRNSAHEIAGFLACVDRLGERPYAIIDATRDRPPAYVSIMPPNRLAALFGSERFPTELEKTQFREHWRRLKLENAPFRIVSPQGLASAPVDYFDSFLLKRVPPGGERIARVIHEVLGLDGDPYQQVGDIMLLVRVVALVERGKLMADGDPEDMHSTRIRLPD
jgi:Protein of unknown function/Domain of unknown function (DUF1835)